MSRMKDHLLDAADYAEECCGMSASYVEALTAFERLYPDAESVFSEAWTRWISFREYMFDRGGNDDNALDWEF